METYLQVSGNPSQNQIKTSWELLMAGYVKRKERMEFIFVSVCATDLTTKK